MVCSYTKCHVPAVCMCVHGAAACVYANMYVHMHIHICMYNIIATATKIGTS